MWRPSVHGSAFLLLACTLVTIAVGVPLGLGVRQGIFVAACLSLSSAPLVHQFLEGVCVCVRERVRGEIFYLNALGITSQKHSSRDIEIGRQPNSSEG